MGLNHGSIDSRIVSGLRFFTIGGGQHRLALQAILDGETTLKVYNIVSGYTYMHDLWRKSMWFEYVDWGPAWQGIAWLGLGQSNAIWYQEG
jgi:hypothetical protein